MHRELAQLNVFLPLTKTLMVWQMVPWLMKKYPGEAHGHFAIEAKPQFGAGRLFKITGLEIRGVPEVRFSG